MSIRTYSISVARKLEQWLSLFGLDPRKAVATLRALPAFLTDFAKLRRQCNAEDAPLPFGQLYPCLHDRTGDAGTIAGHYFYQDLIVARRVFEARPTRHVDVGSRIDGFVAHLAAFREVEVFDVRKISRHVQNMVFTQADLMGPLDVSLVDYSDSVSCLHALEHFGLGRYGDPINYNGHVHGLNNLFRILRAGGKLYLSVPIGPQRIEFNAHRVFSVAYLMDLFAGSCTIDRFSYVDDHGDLHEDVALSDDLARSSFACFYGCGIFELTKCTRTA